MEIKVAEHCGFCYGVKRAVALAQKAATDRVQGATLGPLIHNPQLIAELASEGIACKDSRQFWTQPVRMCAWHSKRLLRQQLMAIFL